MKDFYSFIARVSFDDDGISVDFPDLEGCFTCAENDDDVYKLAEEVLGLHLFYMEQDKLDIPQPSTIKDIALEDNQSTMIVNVFMPSIRDKINNKVVKKTLTIPSWLNIEAEHRGVNFSQLLQKAIKEHLHIEV